MSAGKYVVLHNAMDESKGVFYTLDDVNGKMLRFDTEIDAEIEVKRQIADGELEEPREVLIVEVVKRGAAATTFLWS